MLRTIVFWIHLACGVTTGLVIAMMSLTGVLLTYERQLLDLADARSHAAIETSAQSRLDIDGLLAAVSIQEPAFRPTSVTLTNDPARAVRLDAGRGGGSRLVHPYSGEILGEGARGLRQFFSAVTGWHRWFNAGGESRAPWRAVTGISNLVFLFLLLSGLYLWLPRVSKWVAFRTHLWFNPKARSAKARDYNWHHVFGFWTAIPLIVIVYSASVFYFGWSNALLYRAFGEAPPQRGLAPPVAAADVPSDPGARRARLSLDALFGSAMRQAGDWRRITLQLPEDGAGVARFTVDRGTGGQPQHRHTLVLDAANGRMNSWEPFSSQTPGRRARSWVRFLHTGEAFGLIGQTIAGIVSATTVVMVWTGLALAWRRLVSPLLRDEKTR